MADKRSMLMKAEVREPLSPLTAAQVRSKNRTPVRTKFIPKPQTPGTSGMKCSSKNENHGYDRFIPNRQLMDNDANHYHMLAKENQKEGGQFQDKMKENLNSEVNSCANKILTMKIKAPENKEGEVAGTLLYTSSKPTPAKPNNTRHIPSTCEKILDAPEVLNDYYLHLLDWGSTGLIGIALYQSVYLWDPVGGEVTDLFGESSMPDDTLITSVKWISEGHHIAIGLSNGTVELWDTQKLARVRIMRGHSPIRVGTLAWNDHILTSGSKNGEIHNHDVRIAQHHTSSFNGHEEEVCGMDWAPDKHYFASGANDNVLNIWDLRKVNAVATAENPFVEIDRPVMSLTEHTSAVKAVAWCPWQRHLLASGGGIGDRHMRIWNTNRGVGSSIQCVDVMSQVSDILWSGTYKEIVCSYGNDLGIWKYSTFCREAELKGHQERVLAMSMSPDGVSVATVGADETLRLWTCFEPPVVKKVKAKKALHESVSAATIR